MALSVNFRKLGLRLTKLVVDSIDMLKLSSKVSIPSEEIELKAIRSQGQGGQNVNKVAIAVHLFLILRHLAYPKSKTEII